MGSVGNNELQNRAFSKLPSKIAYFKSSETYIVTDKTKERFDEGWDTGYTIRPSYSNGYVGRGVGHTNKVYVVEYKGKNIFSHGFRTLSEAKDALLKERK